LPIEDHHLFLHSGQHLLGVPHSPLENLGDFFRCHIFPIEERAQAQDLVHVT